MFEFEFDDVAELEDEDEVPDLDAAAVPCDALVAEAPVAEAAGDAEVEEVFGRGARVGGFRSGLVVAVVAVLGELFEGAAFTVILLVLLESPSRPLALPLVGMSKNGGRKAGFYLRYNERSANEG